MLFQVIVFRYGLALIFVTAALFLSSLLHTYVPDAFLVFFLSGVMAAGWFGRTGAGLFAVIISMVVVGYYFIPPYRAFVIELDEIPYFLSFLLSAVVASWLGSARRLAEERQKAYLDELFEQTPEGIMLVDSQDRVLRVNKEFSRIFGYKGEEIVKDFSMPLFVPPDLTTEAQSIRDRLSDGQDVNVETIRSRRDGSLVHVSQVSFPVITDGRRIAYYHIFRDITDSKRATEALQKSQAKLAHLSRLTTMGELAASIAHEINQPIAAVVTNGNAAVRWLAWRPPNLEGAGEALDCIVRDANRAADVIGRIRSLLRKNPTPMVHQDINEIVKGIVVLMRNEIDRGGVAVTTELADHLPPIVGDRVQLEQVMLNLIINSIDAMSAIAGRARQLRVRSSRAGDSALIEVQDSGPGWDEQHANSMFDAFFTTKENGIGMGLAISRSIVEAHGGRMWAERGSPHGAVLNFTLPFAIGAE